MPRRKFIDKKTATTFSLVHRAGDDPLIHDADAPSMVFAEKATSQPKTLRRARDEDYAYSGTASVVSGSDTGYRSNKVRQRGDLEEEFGLAFKPNEGEAAQHGVFYDDTEYDYMQHMRDLGGEGGGSVTWVEASAPPQVKRKQKLEDALKEISMDDSRSVGTAESSMSKARSLLPEEVLPSEFVRKRTYQDQQDVPDAIAGFQPDMDPRLREVLEALEDEAYVDDADEEDVFGMLVGEGEVDEDEFDFLGEQMMEGEVGELKFDESGVADDDDDGWESDDTIKASSPPPTASTPSLDELKDQGEMIHPPSDVQAQPPADPTSGAWLDEYKKFKSAAKTTSKPTDPSAPAVQPPSSAIIAKSSIAPTSRTNKKSLPPSTNFSMTSSTLSRTHHQQLLDARFDRFEAKYNPSTNDDEANDNLSELGSLASGVSGMSAASISSRQSTVSQARKTGPSRVPEKFDDIIDDFLSSTGSAKGAKRRGMRRGKLGESGDGLKELDEVRQGLGPARIKSRVGGSG